MFCLGVFFQQNRDIRNNASEMVVVALEEKEQAQADREEAEKLLKIVRELAGRSMKEVFKIDEEQEFQKVSLFDWGNKEGYMAQVIVLKYEDPSPELAAKSLAIHAEADKYDPKTGLAKDGSGTKLIRKDGKLVEETKK